METPVSRIALSVAFVLVLVCTVDAMNYLAFPRMGRSDSQNYLAFPRMGRSETKADSGNDYCCGLGLKSMIGQAGKEEGLTSLCDRDAPCCDGLTEVVHQRPRGNFFSFCVPEASQKDHTSEVYGALKSLLRRK